MNKAKSIALCAIVIIISIGFNSPAYGVQSYLSYETINNNVSSIIESELKHKANNESSIVEIGPVKVKLTSSFIQENGNNPSELATIFLQELEAASAYETDDESSLTLSSTRGTQTYSACVSSFLMQIGITWICQDFRASVLNGVVTNKLMLGTSYNKGVGIGTWSHNRSWFEQPNPKELDVNYKGNVSAIIQQGSISYPLTVMAIFDVNHSDLKQHFQ